MEKERFIWRNFFKIFLVIVWSVIFTCNEVEANLGDRINQMIKQVFFSASDDVIPRLDFKKEDLSIPQINVPESPTEEDHKNFLSEISEAKIEYQKIEKQTQEIREKLQKNFASENWNKQNLYEIEGEADSISRKIAFMREQNKKWRERLINYAREKSEIRALIRATEKEQKLKQEKKYYQKKNLGSLEDILGLRLLFSKNSIARILEQEREREKSLTKKSREIADMRSVFLDLDSRERATAELFHKIEKSIAQMSAQEKTLKEQFEQKSDLVALATLSEKEYQQQFKDLEKKRMKQRYYLEDLEAGLEKIKQTREEIKKSSENHETTGANIFEYLQNKNSFISETSEKITTSQEEKKLAKNFFNFLSPLRGDLEVLAGFRDPEYLAKYKTEHNGVDLRAAQGSSVFAVLSGKVASVVRGGKKYAFLVLEHEDQFFTLYGHLSDIFVAEGQRVEAGELIGKSGGTPGTEGAGTFTTGAHLHLEVFAERGFLDPMQFLQ